jgi:hypothetical protein
VPVVVALAVVAVVVEQVAAAQEEHTVPDLVVQPELIRQVLEAVVL